MILKADAALLVFCLLCLTPGVAAQEGPESRAKGEGNAASLALPGAVEKAEAWLRGKADKETGGFDGRWGGTHADLALTSLAALAFMEDGSTPGKGTHGREIAKALCYVKDEVAALAEGEWQDPKRSHLCYQLPLALTFLARIQAVDPGADVRKAGRSIISFFRTAQWKDGGWPYGRPDSYSLISTTYGIVASLALARRAGMDVPQETLDRGAAYIRQCANKDGGFRYCVDPRHPVLAKSRETYLRSHPGTTAGALAALALCGDRESREFTSGTVYFREHMPDLIADEKGSHYWFWLFWGGIAAANMPGETREAWQNQVVRTLLSLQREDGSWTWPAKEWISALSSDPMTDLFATATALFLLRGPAPWFSFSPQGSAPCRDAPCRDAPCRDAVEKGLVFLERTQGEDGGWPVPAIASHDAVFDTALCGLALLAEGSTTKQGRFQKPLEKAVGFLLARVPESGPITVAEPSGRDWERYETWYASFMSLFLAEVFRVDPDPEIGKALERLALRLVNLQKETGGWCHDLRPRVRKIEGLGTAVYSEDLLAATNFASIALVSLQRAGVSVPAETVDKAAAYYIRTQNEDGGFQYGLRHRWPDAVKSEPGRTAGALFALSRLRSREAGTNEEALVYLEKNFKDIPVSAGHAGNVFAVNYLAGALACHRLSPAFRERYAALFYPCILEAQRESGAFRLVGSVFDSIPYNTALALLVLQLPLGHISFAEPLEAKSG